MLLLLLLLLLLLPLLLLLLLLSLLLCTPKRRFSFLLLLWSQSAGCRWCKSRADRGRNRSERMKQRLHFAPSPRPITGAGFDRVLGQFFDCSPDEPSEELA
jgi:hypothetical protein